MEQESMISASEAQKLINEELHTTISLSKVTRMMARGGEIPSEKSLLDKRVRLAKRSDVLAWIHKVQQQRSGGRAAVPAFA
jgi:hypothetical protein